jgi:carbon-monoxide dehydrogenase small subunit/glyceraldehyde dehydrogenase small subunit
VSRSIRIELEVNRRPIRLEVAPNETLAQLLRERLSLHGTKVSCDAQVCGTCTVLVDGRAVSSCTFLAADADGTLVTSVEGLAEQDTGRLARVQRAFVERAAFQCGYCTAGFLTSATALLAEIPNPTRTQVIEYLEGNICRCTGYDAIVAAVLDAADNGSSGTTR